MTFDLKKLTAGHRTVAYSLVEMMVAVAVLGVVVVAFYMALSFGFRMMESARENLRATQILIQRAETIRLYNWTQATTNTWIPTTFVESYDPVGASNQTSGLKFYGTNYLTPMATTYPAGYRNFMRVMNITVRWTNYNGTTPIAHSRTLQTHVARFGMQSYIIGDK